MTSIRAFQEMVAEAVALEEAELSGSIIDIPEHMTFVEWVERLGAMGLKIDGKPFTLRDRPALLPIYEAIPTTIAEANRQTLVIQKAAQMGLTTLEMLADLWFSLKFAPCVVGSYLPDQITAADKSERRFMRLVRSIPEIYRKLVNRRVGDQTVKVGEGNILTRLLGESALLFLWTSGKVTTESRPLDVVSIDEAQAVTLEQADKVNERMSASHIRWRMILSTANMPEADINFFFNLGDQRYFFTECPHCGAEKNLTEHWPDVCQYNTGRIDGAPLNEYCYVCPACGGYIADPQRGRYIATNPGAAFVSFHISQIQSPTITPRDMMDAWNHAATGDQRKSFANRKLGIPYVDRDQLPVTMADCLACEAEGIAYGLEWETFARQGESYYLGLDQMGSFVVAVIKRRLPDGRQAVVHVEAIFSDNPFVRCGELMDQYSIALACIEGLPNINEARRFANRFRGRVYLAKYATTFNSDMLTWGDQASRSDRKTAEEDRERYSVMIQQYKMMQNALHRVRNRHCLFPDTTKLEQEVIERGERKRINLTRDWVFLHFTRTALVVEQDEETRTPKPKVVKIGLDPHFSYANMLCDVAWARVHGASMVILPEARGVRERPKPETPLGERINERMPGLPKPVLDMLDQGAREGTCGGCESFDRGRGYCKLRLLTTRAEEISCELFERAS